MKTENFDYIIRKAWRADIPQLVELGARFYAESNFRGSMEMSKVNYQRTLEKYIDLPRVAAILAVKDGEVLGNAYIYAQNDYTEETVGELYQFYVRPEYRGTGVARSLAESAVLQYAEWNCKRAYVEGSPGFDQLQHLPQFENLWGRFGFKKIGVVLMKEF